MMWLFQGPAYVNFLDYKHTYVWTCAVRWHAHTQALHRCSHNAAPATATAMQQSFLRS
jgi:hypothetical protein